MTSISNNKNRVNFFKPQFSFHVFEKGQNIFKIISSNNDKWFTYEGPVNNENEYLPHGKGKVLEYVSKNKRLWIEGNFKNGCKDGVWKVKINNFWYNVLYHSDRLIKIIRRYDKYGNYYEGNYDLNTLNLEGDATLYKRKQNKYLKVFCESNKIKKIFCYSFQNNLYIGEINKKCEAHGLGIFYNDEENKIYIGNFANDELLGIDFYEMLTYEKENEFNIFKLIMQYYFYREQKYRNLILDILYKEKLQILKKLFKLLNYLLEKEIFTIESDFISFIKDLKLKFLLNNYFHQEKIFNKKKRRRKTSLRKFYQPKLESQKENSTNNIVL